MKKMINARRPIAVCFGIILIASWVLYLIFGSSDTKAADLIICSSFAAITYVAVRLMLRRSCDNRHESYVRKICLIYLIFSGVGTVLSVVGVILYFNPYSMGIMMAVVIATLDAGEKYLYKK